MTTAQRSRSSLRLLVLSLCLMLASGAAFAQERQEREEPKTPAPAVPFDPAEVIKIWPGAAPDETGDMGEEFMLVERRRPFYQITNVSVPTLAVYLPDAEEANGAAILVVPGGGLTRLAIEHEGYEVSQWLNDHGIAAFVLKYRVPGGSRETAWKKGVQDAQRAMGIIRSRAAEWNIDPNGVGAIGFSAGGEIGTRLSMMNGEERLYEKIDAADEQAIRPNFMLNIYPGGLAGGGFRGRPIAMREGYAEAIDENTPPMFFVHAFSDASLNSMMMTLELKKKRIPAELHIFQDGAHGFGARESGSPLAVWPDLAVSWMASLGYLDPPHVRAYPDAFISADHSGAKLPRISASNPSTTLNEAYKSQGRIVAKTDKEIGGYKGAMSSAGAQSRYRISAPVHCVLYKPNLLKGSDSPSLSLRELGPTVVETELGYVMGVDIASKIADADEARLATHSVVAAFDIPTSMGDRMDDAYSAADFVAANCGNQTNIITGASYHPDDFNLDELAVSLTLDGKTVHESNGGVTKGGQWSNLMTLINQIIDKGHTIHEGDLILSGSLGSPIPAKKGTYVAHYGVLGTVGFKME
jgi:2-keto-4-pentenoate hydratase/acetyl esterase/lipase